MNVIQAKARKNFFGNPDPVTNRDGVQGAARADKISQYFQKSRDAALIVPERFRQMQVQFPHLFILAINAYIWRLGVYDSNASAYSLINRLVRYTRLCAYQTHVNGHNIKSLRNPHSAKGMSLFWLTQWKTARFIDVIKRKPQDDLVKLCYTENILENPESSPRWTDEMIVIAATSCKSQNLLTCLESN